MLSLKIKIGIKKGIAITNRSEKIKDVNAATQRQVLIILDLFFSLGRNLTNPKLKPIPDAIAESESAAINALPRPTSLGVYNLAITNQNRNPITVPNPCVNAM